MICIVILLWILMALLIFGALAFAASRPVPRIEDDPECDSASASAPREAKEQTGQPQDVLAPGNRSSSNGKNSGT
jgi:hypothetical protein